MEQAVFEVQVGLSYQGPCSGRGRRGEGRELGVCHIKACYSTWQSYICHINAHVMVHGNHKLLHPHHCYRGWET